MNWLSRIADAAATPTSGGILHVDLNPDFSIGPGLVRSWTVAPDGLRVTFHL